MRLSFEKARILIVGDVMLDQYYFGEVTRISPEAPVPVVRVRKVTSTLGGAANVANNVAHLGAHAVLIGLTGNDEKAREIAALAGEAGIEAALLPDAAVTTTKSRVIGAHQQMLRLDFEEPRTPAAGVIGLLKARIASHIGTADVLVISDYGKGVCGDEICAYTISRAAARKIPVIVDPKAEDWSKYSRATFVSPNLKELCQAAGRTIENEDGPVTAQARKLIAEYHVKHLLITRSEKGMSLVTARSAAHIHSKAQEVYDVSGAGDTVVATFAAALGAGFVLPRALDLANHAAGIVVAKIGTVPVELEELRSAVE